MWLNEAKKTSEPTLLYVSFHLCSQISGYSNPKRELGMYMALNINGSQNYKL